MFRCIDSPKQAKNPPFTRGNTELKGSCNTAIYSWKENSLHFGKGNLDSIATAEENATFS